MVEFYFKEPSANRRAVYRTTVLHYGFDGQTLRYLAHGDELRVDVPRGLYEPSLIQFQQNYYLTMRNDQCGYVAVSRDGLHFEQPQPWRFDDGQDLGNYNTQQHWLTHGDKLYLVYTRRGLDNDHVTRHRAPLLMAEIDPHRLVVKHASERIIVPNRGARLGNFATCPVDANQEWIVVSEWMQPQGCEVYGSDNTFWVARLLWQ